MDKSENVSCQLSKENLEKLQDILGKMGVKINGINDVASDQLNSEISESENNSESMLESDKETNEDSNKETNEELDLESEEKPPEPSELNKETSLTRLNPSLMLSNKVAFEAPQVELNRSPILPNKVAFELPEKIINNKITLNVGGKKFNLDKKILCLLRINFGALHKVVKDNGRKIYFLDRDPNYFSIVIDILKTHGIDQENILEDIDNYSEQLRSELVKYGLIDKSYLSKPKLKLKKMISFSEKHDEIVKIMVNDSLFETMAGTLSRSRYFENKLKYNKSKKFFLSNINPKNFSYVLNFLRTGECFIFNNEILDLINTYEIDYQSTEEANKIVSNFIPYSKNVFDDQLLGYLNTLNPKSNNIPNDTFSFIDNNYYLPTNLTVCTGIENINIIITKSKLSFDSDIYFDLTNNKEDFGEIIEDLFLCIDIPIHSAEYVDKIENHLIEHISLVINGNNIILQTNPWLLHLHPIIYGSQFSQLPKTYLSKLLYQNELVDIQRIFLPLHLFRDKQNHLPIQKMKLNKISAQLVVRMAPCRNLIKSRIREIPLLNIFLMANFINLASNIPATSKGSIIANPVNTELKSSPIMYVYDKIHFVSIPVQKTNDPLYDHVVIPLGPFGFIKDFFFTISEKSSYVNHEVSVFTDKLIEAEIILSKENGQKKILALHYRADSFVMNSVMPIKKLGHSLPCGVYYHSFSSNPLSSAVLGGLYGQGYLLRIKVRKMDGFVNFYATEYHKEIF